MATVTSEVNKIMNNGFSAVNHTVVDITLHSPAGSFKLTRIKNILISSNYHGAVSDTITVSCLLPFGDFVHDILAYKDRLACTIKSKFCVGSYKDENNIEAFKTDLLVRNMAVFLDNDISGSVDEVKRTIGRDILNKENPKALTFNCIDLPVFALKRVIPTLCLKEAMISDAIEFNFTRGIIRKNVCIGGTPLIQEVSEGDVEKLNAKQSEAYEKMLELQQKAESEEGLPSDDESSGASEESKEEDATSKNIIYKMRCPDNDDVLSNITIDNMPGMELDLTTVPFMLQDVYGVYNGGMCSYYGTVHDATESKIVTRMKFRIKPKFDPREITKQVNPINPGKEASDDEKKEADEKNKRMEELKGKIDKDIGGSVLNIYIPSNYGDKNAERTCRVVGRTVDIICFDTDKLYLDGKVSAIEKSKALLKKGMTKGIMGDFTMTVDGDEITTDQIEYRADSLTKTDGPDFSAMLEDDTVNSFKAKSESMLHFGNVGSITWKNSTPWLLEPCMPVRVHYQRKDEEGKEKIYTYVGNILMVNSGLSYHDVHDDNGKPRIHTDSEIVLILTEESKPKDDENEEG